MEQPIGSNELAASEPTIEAAAVKETVERIPETVPATLPETIPQTQAEEITAEKPSESAAVADAPVEALEKLDLSGDAVQEKKEEPAEEHEAAKTVQEEAVAEEHIGDGKVTEAAVVEAPAKEEPAEEEPAKEEPAKEELAKEEPAKEEPAKEEPIVNSKTEEESPKNAPEPSATDHVAAATEEPVAVEEVKEAAKEPILGLSDNPITEVLAEKAPDHVASEGEPQETTKTHTEVPVTKASEETIVHEHDHTTGGEKLATQESGAAATVAQEPTLDTETAAIEVPTTEAEPVTETVAKEEKTAVDGSTVNEPVEQQPAKEDLLQKASVQAVPAEEVATEIEAPKETSVDVPVAEDIVKAEAAPEILPAKEVSQEHVVAEEAANEAKPSADATAELKSAVEEPLTKEEVVPKQESKPEPEIEPKGTESNPAVEAEAPPAVAALKAETVDVGNEEPVAEEPVVVAPASGTSHKSGHTRIDSAIDGLVVEAKDGESTGKETLTDELNPIKEVKSVLAEGNEVI